MKRSVIQSISRNLAASLQALDVAVAEAKGIRHFMRLSGTPAEGLKDVTKVLKYFKEKRVKQAVLQWKLKKAIAGNESYLTGADLQALRSFLKDSIKLNQEVISELWAFRKLYNGWDAWKVSPHKKGIDKQKRMLKTDEDNQREVRKAIVAEGLSSRDMSWPTRTDDRHDDEMLRRDGTQHQLVGKKVVVNTKVPQTDDEYNDYEAGWVTRMEGMVGKTGYVVSATTWNDFVLLFVIANGIGAYYTEKHLVLVD